MFGLHANGFDPAAGPDAELWEDFPGSPTDPRRRPAVKGRITGQIAEWKGKFGWIVADSPINHPEARMKGGRIYLSQEDVAEVISGVGAHVSFYVYADGTGLGAMLCCPSDHPSASQPLQKRGLKASAKPTAKAKPKATPVGRKRVSNTQLTGTVTTWKATFGFLSPTEPIEHPLYTGKLFVSKGDVLEPDDIGVGKSATFFLYADPQGLGAEEVAIVGGEATPGASPVGSPQALDVLGAGGGGSTLLQARPKAPPGSPPAEGASVVMVAKPKLQGGGMMRPTPKPGPGMRPSDSELASKMTANPELAKQLSAWMFDPGG